AALLLEQIAQAEPVAPRWHRPEMPRDLETVLLKCLAKEPAQRYASAQELADDLRRVVNFDPVRARRPSPLRRLWRGGGRRRGGAGRVGAGAAAVRRWGGVGRAGGWGWGERGAGGVGSRPAGPPARAELATRGGEPVASFTLPLLEPLELPA